MWMNVDAALAEVPVNSVPLTSSDDYETVDETIAYNESGMELYWHFTTTAGATTHTQVTPTTDGDYDWAHQDHGMYTIEIPATGGASANNDTEGFGYFTGKADNVLPWRGPTIGFRLAAINTMLVNATSADEIASTQAQVDTAISDAEPIDANVTQIGGVVQSLTDLKDFVDTGYDPSTHLSQTDVARISGSSIAADILAAKNYSAYSDGVVTVADSTTDTGRATNLSAALTSAESLTPGGNALATNNRATLLVPPGRYDFATGDGTNHGLLLDTEFVDVVGLGERSEDVVLTSQIATESRGTIEQTADDVRITNLTLDIESGSAVGSGATNPAAYFPATALSNTVTTDVIFQTQNTNSYAMRTGIDYAGEYNGGKCIGVYGYGGGMGTMSGTCNNTTHIGDGGYGGSTGTMSGECNNTTHIGNYGYGGEGTLSGTCNNTTHIGNYGYGGKLTFEITSEMSGTCNNTIHIGASGYAGGGGTLSGTLNGVTNIGNAGYRNCSGATIENSFLRCTTDNTDCLILGDSLSSITNSTILVLDGGTGIPIDDDGNARSVCASGNRFNNSTNSSTGLGTSVTNTGVQDSNVIETVTDQFGFTNNRVQAVVPPSSSGIGDNSFLFSLSAAAADPKIISSASDSDADTPFLDGNLRDTTYVTPVTGTQWQITLSVLQADPEANPWVEYSSSDTGVATVDQSGLVTYVGDGTCEILGSSGATDNSPARVERVSITNTTESSDPTVVRTYVADALDVSKHVLIVHTDSVDSTAIKTYYKANRPGMSSANELELSGISDGHTCSYANFETYIETPIKTWLGNNADKPIRYIVLCRGVPQYSGSDENSFPYQITRALSDAGTRTGASYRTANSRFTLCEFPGMTALVAVMDMGSQAATLAYIDKLATFGTGAALQADGVTISPTDASYGGDHWNFDNKRTIVYDLFGYMIDVAYSRVLTEGIDVGDITYQSAQDGTMINNLADVTYYESWGTHNGVLSNGWGNDGSMVFTGDSNWYALMTVESYNGIYGSSQGDITEFFSATAMDGTAYSNTPACFVGHTYEPGVSGVNTQYYAGLWARGWTAAEVAWQSRKTVHFIFVGDPLITR